MKRRLLWCALIITAAITITWPMIPISSAGSRLATVPESSLDYQVRPLELTAADRSFLGEASAHQYLVAMRGGGSLVLTVIDGSRNRHAVHDPAYCFSGGGWKPAASTSIKLASGEGTRISLTKDHQKAEALWFFDDGGHQFTSPVEYWLKTSARRVTLGRSGDEPVLVTLRSLPDDPVNWDRVRQILLPAFGF